MHVLFSNETGNVPQIVYYQSGVGSESDFLGSINTTTKEVVRKFWQIFNYLENVMSQRYIREARTMCW